jgi:tetratricopeptide (TPR) repeat protein
MALIDEAVRVFPRSAKLWVMRGDLLQLGPENSPYPLEESLASYKRALEIDPLFAEAWQSAAHFYDAVMADPQAAAPFFREFERLSGRPAA